MDMAGERAVQRSKCVFWHVIRLCYELCSSVFALGVLNRDVVYALFRSFFESKVLAVTVRLLIAMRVYCYKGILQMSFSHLVFLTRATKQIEIG